MGAYQLAEIAVGLIETQIKTHIVAALAAVRTERNDPIVSTDPPKEYFQFEMAHVYRAPAVFTIIQGMDIRDTQMKANHINAMSDIVVAVVVEDRVQSRLVKKAWRYQSALMACLHQVSLTSTDGAVKVFSRVQACEFSGIVNLKDERAADAVFRKEVSLKLQVEHIENLE
jgi:hypothetical protein